VDDSFGGWGLNESLGMKIAEVVRSLLSTVRLNSQVPDLILIKVKLWHGLERPAIDSVQSFQ